RSGVCRAVTKGCKKASSRGSTPWSTLGRTRASSSNSLRRTRKRRSISLLPAAASVRRKELIPQGLAFDQPDGHSRISKLRYKKTTTTRGPCRKIELPNYQWVASARGDPKPRIPLEKGTPNHGYRASKGTPNHGCTGETAPQTTDVGTP